MQKTIAAPTSLVSAVRYFSNPDVSLAFLAGLRWPDGVTCPICGSKEQSFLKTRRIWKCKGCQKQFSVKLGTIFEDSPIGLEKWLPAIWLLVNAKNGISSYELGRALGVTQKTAWFMLHRIRLAMQTKTFNKFRGDVEVDETYIGGLARFMHKGDRKKANQSAALMSKTAVMGLLERHGHDPLDKGASQVRVHVVPTSRAGICSPTSPPKSSRGPTCSPTPTRPTVDWSGSTPTRSLTTPSAMPRARSTPTGWRTSGAC